MKVHLIPSKELSLDTYINVWNLLTSYRGPIEYVKSKSVESDIKLEEKEWDSESVFNTQIRPVYSIKVNHFVKEEIVFPFKEKQSTWEDLFKICDVYRRENKISNNDLVILLTDVGNDKNWFGAVDEDMKNIFIQTSHWSEFFGTAVDSRFPIAYEVVVWALRISMYANRMEILESLHEKPKGCMMDFCVNKTEIVLKMRTADICLDCLSIVNKKDVPRNLLNQVLETMDGIRTYLLFRERSNITNQPSRIEIRGYTKQIFLKDLGNLEVRLNPKEKTIFLFFLAHPEGIRIVDLVDYKEEITALYERFSNLSSQKSIQNSLELLLDSSDGNINQVLARIRTKFKALTGERLSQHYTVEGIRNEVYKIALNRELVIVCE